MVVVLALSGCPWGDYQRDANVTVDAPCGALPENQEQRDIQLAQCLAVDEPIKAWAKDGQNAPVVLYVDRSGSMRGFLDPDYPSRTDYRSVIDRLIVSLNPQQAFGFGSSVTPIETSLGTLGDRNFYTDNNTEMEDVLDRIASDTAAGATHLIIGDGRRSDPNAANDQFARMRRTAQNWIDRGGTFLLAASRAPFEPVPGDPAGCRPAEDSGAATCPLYAFAFIAPGDEARVVNAFAHADAFEHLFVWPLPGAASTGITADQAPNLSFEPQWGKATSGAPVARARGQTYINQPVPARLELGASDAATRAALAGQTLRSQISTLPLDNRTGSWTPVSGPASLVRSVNGQPGNIEFLSRGADAPRQLYKVELYPTGEAPWLDKFDATSANDEVRTYGLGRLFELFRTRAQSGNPAPVQRAYVVVN